MSSSVFLASTGVNVPHLAGASHSSRLRSRRQSLNHWCELEGVTASFLVRSEREKYLRVNCYRGTHPKRLVASASGSTSISMSDSVGSFPPPPEGYRANVGVCVVNSDNKVFVASRSDTPGAWQMPQVMPGPQQRHSLNAQMHFTLFLYDGTLVFVDGNLKPAIYV